MITIENVYVQFGHRILLNKVNLVIGAQDKIGLVGRNGAGKSTLLKIIAGEMGPHEGRVARPSGSSLAFLHQEIEIPKGRTILDEAMTAFADIQGLERKLEAMQEEIAERTDYESDSYHTLLDEFSTLNDRLAYMGGLNIQAQTERVLKGLGFKPSDLGRLVDEFSGGWQMRVELAKMLLGQPDYLLLDEPTNHLDIESILWLEGFLKDYPSAIILISHDKEFLNNVTNRTVEVELGKLADYKAPYKAFVELRQERREKQRATFENQQRVIADRERTINRFMAKASKTKMAQSMQKQLDKMDRVEVEEEDVAVMNLRFPPAPRSGQIVIEGKGVVKQYGALEVLNGVNLHIERGQRVGFVGQNGQGKSTLAKILVGDIPATSGEIKAGHNVMIGYYAQNQSEVLSSALTVLQTMEQEAPAEVRPRVRHILGAFMFSGEDADKKVSVLSGGERARLALACLLLKPFNLLVLDEPTNHLDILSKDVLKQALLEYDGALIVVSHDREFLDGLCDRTIEFRDGQLYEYLGDVNYFLEKRQLDNMRQVEVQTPSMQQEQPPRAPVSREERKQLQRTVQQAEKKIERLEAEIAKMEALMADPGFYTQPSAAKTTQAYSELKDELELAMEEWEKAQSALESME